jgi:hypothetical protein
MSPTGREIKIEFGLVVKEVAVSALTFIVKDPYTLVSVTLIE